MPLVQRPGQAQGDFGHAVARIGGRLPREGQSVLRRWTTWRTKSGNMLTGSLSCPIADEPSSSIRFSQAEIVSGSTRNARAAWADDHPRAALSSGMAIRSAVG